jgi:hypothetical protein
MAKNNTLQPQTPFAALKQSKVLSEKSCLTLNPSSEDLQYFVFMRSPVQGKGLQPGLCVRAACTTQGSAPKGHGGITNVNFHGIAVKEEYAMRQSICVLLWGCLAVQEAGEGC